MAYDWTRTDDWVPLLMAQAGDIPLDYLRAWILRESNGSPCSYTGKAEAGIFQLMPPDNVAQGGTTLDLIHPSPPCTPGIQTTKWFADLTPDQQNEQVRSGIQYVNFARARVHQLLVQYGGADWDEGQDFWTMVKMYHNLPGVIPAGLAAAQQALGRSPQTWAEFRQYAGAYGKWLDYAEWIGSYAGGGPDLILDLTNIWNDATDPVSTPPPTPLSGKEIILAGIFAVGAFFAARRASRYLFGREPV